MTISDWYPFNPIQYRRDTYHLCAAADGIYRRLIDEYMVTRKPLPDCDASLAGIARVTAQEWGEHRSVMRAFFKAKDGKLFHKRCEQELHAQSMRAASRSLKAKEAATIRWAKDKKSQSVEYEPHAPSNADAMRFDATLHNNKRTLTTTVVGERLLQPTEEQKRACSLATSEELRSLLAKKSKPFDIPEDGSIPSFLRRV